MSDSNALTDKEFYFMSWFYSVIGRNGSLPQVERDSIVEYSGLGDGYEFYFGRTNSSGQLSYMETWGRTPVDSGVDLDAKIGQNRLRDFDVPYSDDGELKQQPFFFMQHDNEWKQVPIEATKGETTFLRLRVVRTLGGNQVEKIAEVLRQELTAKEEYIFSPSGDLIQKKRQLKADGFKVKLIDI